MYMLNEAGHVQIDVLMVCGQFMWVWLTGLWVLVEVLGDEGGREEALTELGLSPPPVLI